MSHTETTEAVEEMARKLHTWYLEAIQLETAEFNPNAAVPYDLLPEGSKLLDRYIARNVIAYATTIRKETLEECIKLSDEIELREPDGGTKQWMAFKGLRNTLRDRLSALKK